jgi:hypothetical protein
MCQSSTGYADPRRMKLCPIHRTSLFLSDGWESVERHDIVVILLKLHFCFFLGHDFSRALTRLIA